MNTFIGLLIAKSPNKADTREKKPATAIQYPNFLTSTKGQKLLY